MKTFFRQCLICVLIALLILPPAAFAGGISADPAAPAGKRPGVDATINGTPLVNITRPSASGLSHNQYSDFNTDRRGVVLNNSDKIGVSQLGGTVMNNPNLAGSGPARTILNEVTSANRSHIEGYIEVFGGKADVILANPNGVTINGGGFINTGRAMVTTGRPDVDAAGNLKGIDVRQGDVRVEGAGINASNLTGFDILSRAAEINAAIYADELNITTGQNRYDPATRTATPLPADGSAKPGVAIDSTALGGMYAGRITLVSSEKGVGVNMRGVVQSASDLRITAEGTLTVNEARSAGGMRLNAGAHDLRISGAAVAGGDLSASGRNISGAGATLASEGALSLAALEKLTFTGDSLLSAKGHASLRAGQEMRLENSQARSERALALTAETLTADNSLVGAGGGLGLNAASATLRRGSWLQGNGVEVDAGNLFLMDSRIASLAGLRITAPALNLQGGALSAEADMTLASRTLTLGDSLISAKRRASLSAGQEMRLDNSRVIAEQALALTTGAFTADNSLAAAGGDLGLNAASATLRQGAWLQGNGLEVDAGNLSLTDSTLFSLAGLRLAVPVVSLQGGALRAEGDAKLTASTLWAQGGSFIAGGDLEASVDSASLTNAVLAAGKSLLLAAGGNLLFSGNTLVSGQTASDIRTAQLLRLENGATLQGGDLNINAAAITATDGIVQAADSLTLTTGDLTNSNSIMAAGGDISARVGQLTVTGTQRQSGASLDLWTTRGSLYAGGNLDLVATGNMQFTGGLLGAQGNAGVQAQQLAVEAADLHAGRTLRLDIAGAASFTRVDTATQGDLRLSANSLALAGASLSAGGGVFVALPGLAALDALSSLLGFSGLDIAAADLTNAGLIFSGGNMRLALAGDLDNREGGNILSLNDMTLTGSAPGSRMATLRNTAATIESLSGDMFIDADALLNGGGAVSTRRVDDGETYLLVGGVSGQVRVRGDWVDQVLNIPGFTPDGGRNYADVLYYDYGNYALSRISFIAGIDENSWGANSGAIDAYLAAHPGVNLGTPSSQSSNRAQTLQEWRHTAHDEVTGSSSPASILAGGNMVINAGRVDNAVSTLSAGNDLRLNADRLDNTGVNLYSYTDVYQYVTGVLVGQGSPGSEGRDISLRIFTAHWEDHSSNTLIGAAPSIITAGRLLEINVADQFNNSSIMPGVPTGSRNIAAPVHKDLRVTGVVDPRGYYTPVDVPGAVDALAGMPSRPAGMDAALGAASAPFDLSRLPALGALFSLSTNSNHNYVIETNPKLSSLNGLYGSEYFLNRMGYDLAREQTKLLGDAFYEARMVREQILARSGQRFLFAGVTDDAETMHRLMDNAAEESRALGLSVGVALTADQVKNLSRDIVWLEEVQYNGQTALAPRLYLCEATLAELSVRGATVSGEDVRIAAGSVTNTNVIRGNNVQIASLSDILNRGGQLEAKNALVATAGGSIVNTSGILSGMDVRLAAAKDIRFETAVAEANSAKKRAQTFTFGRDDLLYHLSTGVNTSAVLYETGRVTASGNLSLAAGNNVVFAGASAQAGGTAAITAGNDIVLGSQSYTSGFDSRRLDFSSTGQILGNVSGNTVDLKAGNDLTLAGASVTAKDDASLAAGRNIAVLAVQESDSHHRNSGSTKIRRESTGVVGSSVTGGGDVTLRAGLDADRGPGNITVVGSVLAAGTNPSGTNPLSRQPSGTGASGTDAPGTASGRLTLSATGDVIIAEATESSYESKYKKSSGFMSSSVSLKEKGSATSVGSSLSGTDVDIRAGQNVLISGSSVAAKNDLAVRADTGDVVVAAAQDTSWDRSVKKKSGWGFFPTPHGFDIQQSSSSKEVNSRASNAGSLLTAGNNLTLDAGRDVSIIGSEARAGNDLGLSAGRDVNIIPGREQQEHEKVTKKSGMGLSFSAGESGVSMFAGFHSKEKGLETTGDYTAGSMVGAGRDVVIEAGRDVNQVGSHIEAGRDAVIDAGQDWNMLASYDRETLHQYIKEVRVGISASISQNVSSAARTLADLPQSAAAGQGGGGYSALTAASAGLRAVDAVKSAVNEFISVSATVGTSFSQSDYRSESRTARPSSVTAGRDVAAFAGRDISIEGGQIIGGRDVILDAGQDLTIAAAKSTGKSTFSSSGGSFGLGVRGGVGAPDAAGNMLRGGLVANAAAQGSGGGDRHGAYTNSRILAGDLLSTTSGRDTRIAGARLEGDRTWMDVGRDLTIASVQDSYDSKSSSWNAGISVTMGGGFNVSGNLGYGQGKSTSDWTGAQTAVIGRKEVDIYVENNTHIKGAIIATEPGGDLTLNTGSLTFEEIKDKTKSKNWHAAVSGGFNISGGGFDQKDSIKTGLPGPFAEIKPYDYSGGASAGGKSSGDPSGGKSSGGNSSGDPSGGKSSGGKSSGGAPYLPDTLELQYSSQNREGVLRPTVTEGAIIVRSNPDAATDGSLVGLNRDIDKAREIAKDEKVNVDVYVSPGAIAEVIGGFKGITGQMEAYEKAIKHLVESTFSGEQAKVILDLREEGLARIDALDIPDEQKVASKIRLETELIFKGNLDSAIRQYGTLENIPESVLRSIIRDRYETYDLCTSANLDRNGGDPGSVLGTAEYTARTMGETAKSFGGSIWEFAKYLRNASCWVSTGGGNFGPEDWKASAREYDATNQTMLAVAKEIATNPVGVAKNVATTVSGAYAKHQELMRKGDFAGAAEISGNLYGEIAAGVAMGKIGSAVLQKVAGAADWLQVASKKPSVIHESGASAKAAQGLIGREFEDYLTKSLGGKGSFKMGGREFDGAYGSVWYEAKSGRYWQNQVQANTQGFDKFKSDIGAHAAIARSNGATYEVYSNTPIPQHVKDYLNSKSIPFKEF